MRAVAARRGAQAALLSLVLVATACGQKTGVGGTIAGAAGFSDTGFEEGFVEGAEEGLPVEEGGEGGAAAGGPAAQRGGPAGAGPQAGPAGNGAADTGAGGPADRTGITEGEIKIGIHAPESGAAAVSTFRDAVGVYARFAGRIPGLGNRQLVIEARDDKFDPAEARRVCKELVEVQKVFVLVGGAGVDQIKSCAEYAASVGVPYFSPGVTEGPFRGLQNYFALSETYNQQNVQVAQLIKNQVQKSRLGIVLTDSPLLKETEESIKAEAAKNGLQVVYTGTLAKNASTSQTDTEAGNLKNADADVVYALISPTVFVTLVQSAKTTHQYFPTYVGPGLSIGVNLVAKPVCTAPFPDIRYLSPMVQMDVIDAHDADYQPAYRAKNGATSQPDDIGILLWGIEKLLRQMMESTGPDLSRQSLMAKIKSGEPYATNVYSPVAYGDLPHFGANTVTLLQLDCGRLEFTTAAAFASEF